MFPIDWITEFPRLFIPIYTCQQPYTHLYTHAAGIYFLFQQEIEYNN